MALQTVTLKSQKYVNSEETPFPQQESGQMTVAQIPDTGSFLF